MKNVTSVKVAVTSLGVILDSRLNSHVHTVCKSCRFRTEQGHCGACRRKWRLTDTDLCPCGETQTMSHIVESCPLTKLMAAYLGYTLRMKMLFRG